MHFAGAQAEEYFPLTNRCSDLWMQHSWQYADSVGREDLARAIAYAEERIANELGWWPAPVWINQEIIQYPKYYRINSEYMRRLQHTGIHTKFTKIIAPGHRAVTEIVVNNAIVFTDEDGDGFAETATLEFATTVTNINEILIFYSGKNGDAIWEIRPARSKLLNAGIATFVFWSWQMIDPIRWEEIPNFKDEQAAIDLSGLGDSPIVTTNLVLAVDAYRVYNDISRVAMQLYWEPLNCDAALTLQDGTFSIRDAELGLVVPLPANYDAELQTWKITSLAHAAQPAFVKLWYQAGLLSNSYLAGTASDPLSNKWAFAISQLAVAGLERPFCSCGNTFALCQKWQLDLAQQGESSWNISRELLDNPFGTRYGEIECWKVVNRERRKIMSGGAV